VTAQGIRLHCLDWGGIGPPLVFLTGFGDTAHDFDGLAGHFSSRFRVVAMTRRGRAPSDQPRSGYDLARLTADVTATMDALKVDRAHFAGHSIAGTEMMRFARLHPDRMLSAVFIDAAVDPAAAWSVMAGDPQGAPKSPPGSVLEQIDLWWTTHPAQFAAVRVPALAIYALQDAHPYPPLGASADLLARLNEYWRTDWNGLVRQTAERFRRSVPGGRVVFMNGPHHLYRDNQSEVIGAMEAFYAALPGK
jgi:pimeloyl-ACP methyl ester carboxylesterase